MASPYVSGVAALIWHRYKLRYNNKALPEDDLYKMLKSSTIDISRTGVDSLSGAGFVTFYPEIPKKSGSGWSLPNMSSYQP